MQYESFLKKDFSDMIKIFLEEQVRFLLVGGISINLYGYVRATKVFANFSKNFIFFQSFCKFFQKNNPVNFLY